jgi:hypothetical protein
MTWGSKISGSYVTHLTVTPNSTVAASTIAAAGHLTVGGNLTVSGTTTTVNSTVTTVKDPIMNLGGGDDGAAPGSDDNKDRGLILQWHNGSAAKLAFMGFDDSDSKFMFVPDASVSSEVISGTIGTIKAAGIDFNDTTSLTTGAVALQGLQTIWVPASAMRPTSSNGCAAITDVETTSGRPDMQVLDFDASSDEHAQFSVAFPKSWNAGTVTFQFFWTSAATDTDGVSFGLQGVSVVDGATIDVAYGTAVVVDDANQSTAEDLYVSAASSAITIASAADDAVTFFRIFRDVSDANDTAAEDARLVGVKLYYTTNAGNDA